MLIDVSLSINVRPCCTYIEKLEGKNAVLDINIPALKIKNTSVKRPTCIPNSRHILLQ